MTREDFVDEYEDEWERQAAGEAWDQAFHEICHDDLSLREAFGDAEDRFVHSVGDQLFNMAGLDDNRHVCMLGWVTYHAMLPYLYTLTKDRAEDLLPKYMPDETDRRNERELRNAG